MRVAIIDADFIGRDRHRFPNLVSEKISAYWKGNGADVELKLDYENLDEYDEVYISKVFTDTPFPDGIKETDRIHLGGTGFYFDHAPNLPLEIEHHMPDYHLYDDAIGRGQEFRFYTDYSIGFLTRGCFRRCEFCVNKKYDHVFQHSPLSEFYDPTRKKICLLDDNFFGCLSWKPMLQELIDTDKPFVFKQGLDERILTDEKCEMLFNAKYDGDFIFAFDKIADYDLVHRKLEMIRRHTDSTQIKFYVLVGFESIGVDDIVNAFRRIELLARYRCQPYIMRYMNKDGAPWQHSEYRGMYITLARWCNQPSMFKRLTLRDFANKQQQASRSDKKCASIRYLEEFERKHPNIARRYFDMKWEGEQEQMTITKWLEEDSDGVD